VKKIVDNIFRGIEVLIAFFLAVMIILTFMNVVLRYAFGTGFAWSEEIARLAFIFLVYLGSIEAMRDNRHLLIDSVLVRLPPLGQRVLYGVLQAVIIWLMYILTEGSFRLMIQNFQNSWAVTHFPTWVVYAVGAIMGVSIALLALINIFRVAFTKTPVPELLAARDSLDEGAPQTQEVG